VRHADDRYPLNGGEAPRNETELVAAFLKWMYGPSSEAPPDFGWHYPPGCTQRDVDEQADGAPQDEADPSEHYREDDL
jgi:hypothetical protein